MTNKEKTEILALRKEGYSIPQIAEELQVPLNTVKSFLYRKSQPAAEDGPVAEPNAASVTLSTTLPSSDRVVRPCLYCGKDVRQLPHHKTKKFCGPECRVRWWNENKGQSQGKRISAKTCPACGETFRAYGNRKYCSHACYISARFGKKAKEANV